MKTVLSTQFYTERDGKELELEVYFRYWPATRGHCDRYGAQEEQDTDAEIEIQAATLHGQPFELTEAEQKRAEQACWDTLDDLTFDASED